jgi:hypothetical protein
MKDQKMRKKNIGVVAILVILVSMASISPAYAYLDPGTGSILLQLILGGVAGLLVVVKLYWHRFMSFFRREDNPTISDE